MSSSIAVAPATAPSDATPPAGSALPPAFVAVPEEAGILAAPGQSFYLIAMCHFLSGFSPGEKPGAPPPAS